MRSLNNDKAPNTLLDKPIITEEDLNIANDFLVRAILDASELAVPRFKDLNLNSY